MDFAFISPADMMVVMAVALIVFGPKRLPEVGRQLGAFMRDFRRTISEFTETVEGARDDFHSVVRGDPSEPYRPPAQQTVQPGEKAPSYGSLMEPYDQREPIQSAPRFETGQSGDEAPVAQAEDAHAEHGEPVAHDSAAAAEQHTK